MTDRTLSLMDAPALESADKMTEMEVELGEKAKSAAATYQGFTLFSVILLALGVACYSAHLAADSDVPITFFVGLAFGFLVLCPVWLRARAYAYDLRRRQRFMDRN